MIVQKHAGLNEKGWVTFKRCSFFLNVDLNKSVIESYLGLPWDTDSRVIVIESFIDDHIHSHGRVGSLITTGMPYTCHLENDMPC